MTSKHTPGPWEDKEGASVYGKREGKPYSYRIAEVLGYQEEREANALLIAAAPEMREMLRDICTAWDCQTLGATEDAVRRARALMARIDGEA